MIRVENLTKKYGDKTALDDINFSIDAGEVVGLLGLNGAGKTTTMNILTGYISATGGSVSVGGFDITSEAGKAKKLIGYMPEQPAFYPEVRVDEHLGFICDLKGIYKDKKEREKHINDICARVGISDVKRRMIRNLSKGYKQRVAFAQALVGHPKVIILDEPTAGLDPSQIVEIRKLVKDSGKNSTVIVSSHILSEVQTVCSRVIVLNEGRVIADDAPDKLTGGSRGACNITIQVKGAPEDVSTTLRKAEGVTGVKRLSKVTQGVYDFEVSGAPDSDIREAVFFALSKAGMPILAMRNAGLTLEDVFLRLTGGTERG